jgi:hypothetical protein
MLSLSELYRNCYCDGKKECLLANVLLPDFLKIDRKLEKLKKQEEAIKL